MPTWSTGELQLLPSRCCGKSFDFLTILRLIYFFFFNDTLEQKKPTSGDSVAGPEFGLQTSLYICNRSSEGSSGKYLSHTILVWFIPLRIHLEAVNAKTMSLALFCFVYKVSKLNFQCWVQLQWGSCLDDAVAHDILGHHRNTLLNWVGFDSDFKKLNAWICASRLLVQMVGSKLKLNSIFLIHLNSPKHHLSYSQESQFQVLFPNAWSSNSNCGRSTAFLSELFSSMCPCACWCCDWFFFCRSNGNFWNCSGISAVSELFSFKHAKCPINAKKMYGNVNIQPFHLHFFFLSARLSK